MVKDNAANDPLIGGAHIISVHLKRFKTLDIEPVFRFGIAFATMNMDRLVPFIGVKIEPPPQNHEYRRHLIPYNLSADKDCVFMH
jgi:hypothetical protein